MPEKILIVDDDFDTLRLIGVMLERQGYQVIAASNGRQALSLAKGDVPDLVLLDIMMPDMDGYQVARQLREDTRTASTPIIMFTAKITTEDKLLGFEVGADDYLTKPTQPRELMAHIKAVLGRSVKAAPVPASKETGHIIAVLGAKGGLGVTTLALNLGIAIHQQAHKEVIVAEFRPGYGSLSLELGFHKPEGLCRLLQLYPFDLSVENVAAELVPHSSGIRLLLSSPQPSDAKYLSALENFGIIASRLPQLAQYTLLDLGPGLPPVTTKALGYCDHIITVTEPVPNTIAQTRALIEDLYESGVGEGQLEVVLLNRVRSEVQLNATQAQQRLGLPISAVITPAPELAYQASQNATPLILQQPNSLCAEQIGKLASILTDRDQ